MGKQDILRSQQQKLKKKLMDLVMPGIRSLNAVVKFSPCPPMKISDPDAPFAITAQW